MRTAFVGLLAATLLTCVIAPAAVSVADTPAFDAAVAFGARPSALELSLSPDGKHILYQTPLTGQGAAVFTLSLAEKDAKPQPALVVKGAPERIIGCTWIGNDRLLCRVHRITKTPAFGLIDEATWVAMDRDGRNLKSLSTLPGSNPNTHLSIGFNALDGGVVDWLPGQDGALLMERAYFANDATGSRIGSSAHGLGLDHVDTRTLAITTLEEPNPATLGFISDGNGVARIKLTRITTGSGDIDTGVRRSYYRTPDSKNWKTLGDYNATTDDGFVPLAVDSGQNIAYGLKKKDGRKALYSISLDGNARETLVFERPDVDVSGVAQIGRNQRVIGASYTTDSGHIEYFANDVQQMMTTLHKALPKFQLQVADMSADGNKMLIFADSDTDPGVYYLFDRPARKLETFLVARAQLEGMKLATQRSISYPGSDGVMIPAYLTLPPDHQDLKGLPAIVLPHGGPSSRDVWGFDWLPQFFANRGYAIIQPEFRGSAGYGDAWFEQNGFKSWRVAIDDVLAAGHWLVSQGVDPAKLAVVGWSYGGYAALQSAVVEPDTFKAVIAIAPVTDLAALAAGYDNSGHPNADKFLGDPANFAAASPAQHAKAIKAPVLLFHGSSDVNVDITQSRLMADKLKAAGVAHELVTWDGLDHQLDDSAARAQLLRKSDELLRKTLGLPALTP